MKPVAIIQARCGSTRLPGKVLKPLAGHTVLDYVVRRCQLSRSLAGVVVATTEDPADDAIEGFCRERSVPVFRGSQEDVLLRYVDAACWSQADPIVRITSDCPLIEPEIIDRVVASYADSLADYVFIQGYPRGCGDAEVMTLPALQRSLKETSALDTGYREHVMTYLTDHPEQFRLQITDAPAAVRNLGFRLCVDQAEDLLLVQTICEHFSPRMDFRLEEIVAFLAQNPHIAAINRNVAQKS
jgi:spore coat polysaccharide biosynthesis protein SpsF